MGVLEDVLNALDRIPKWRRVSESPERLDALEKRVTALEGAPVADRRCELCRQPAAKVTSRKSHPTFGRAFGHEVLTYTCGACGESFDVDRDPSKPSA